jgi:hypothetical protein
MCIIKYLFILQIKSGLINSVGIPTSVKTETEYLFFYYLVCVAIGTTAASGLLCQPRVIMKMTVEKQMECRLAGETEVLGENMPQSHFCPSPNPT